MIDLKLNPAESGKQNVPALAVFRAWREGLKTHILSRLLR
jgi:hypothetical protein